MLMVLRMVLGESALLALSTFPAVDGAV